MGMNMITLAIIVITAIFSFNGFSNYNLFDRYKFQPQAILQGKQYDRLLTSGFLHVDMTHLLFNMLTLYFFADVIIRFFSREFGNPGTGAVLFAVTYLVSILGGNLLALFFQKDNPRYSAVGASGGVSGILFASIVVYPELTLGLFFVIPMPGWLFAILYLGYSVYGMRKQLGNIGHEAHLGGAIIGLIVPLLVKPELVQQNLIYIVGMLIPITVLLVMIVKQRKS